MGKRKAKKVEIRKSKIPKLDKEFNCPFCNNTKTVGVKMNHKERLGHLSCRVCGVEFTTRIGKFDEAVDIFSTWIDKCYEVNNVATEDNLGANSGNVIEEQLEVGEDMESNRVDKMVYSKKPENRSESFSIEDNVDEVANNEDYSYKDDGFNNTTNIDSEKTNWALSDENEVRSPGEDVLDNVGNDYELNIDRKTSEGKSLFDISKITESTVINKSFTMNEDDGLFSD
ncbi:hypothetical protein FG379_003309 [Cryptosporidium bovis]|uniref:uncharacterized protein n=1 Tax=Cryptosporidium bovis TaxID=310047 RepID=UPI003519F38D|nr:hypothetical protein FG379_003309 [Cryptosporidium bovis]